MIYTLTQELEDLLAVTYVMNAMLYILEQEDGQGTEPIRSPPPRKSSTFSTYVNSGIQKVRKESVEGTKSEDMPSEMESVVSVVSSAESVSPQDPTGSRTEPAPSVPEAQNTSHDSKVQAEIPAGCPAIQIEGRKEALQVTTNSGNRILAKLQVENESLSEQVEVLDKMNERLAKKVKDLEQKMRDLDETAEDLEEKDRQLERYKREEEIKNKTLADILGKMEELQKELILNNTSLSECTEQLKDATKKLIFEQKKSEFLETEIKNYLTDQPNIENFEVLKNYLHPEMEKYAVEAVKDAIGTRELRGDAATAYVSKYFDELYGTHWQAVLFRTDGHGALVQHNNNCYIRFRLGNFEMILFRY